MSAIKSCRSCGAGIPGNAPFGHCPKCLLDLGFGPAPEESAAPPATTTEGARIFGDYELIQQIGRGGMGVVYKARQVRLNRLVAIKMIRAGEFASPTLIQRFHREAEATANLQHPNIVSIYETGEIQGQHYLSMALIEGDSLDDHILRSGTDNLTVEKDVRSSVRVRMMEIARIMAKVARAVDHAHQHGVLHRDLKPSNILVDRRGEPHLTDFGLAKVIGRGDSNLTVTGAIMGTPSFMAPEQASGNNKSTSTLADVYSLGAILYTMLTGQPPFRADTPVETLRQVIEQEPKHPSTIREGLDFDLATIAMKCLEKEPGRRYSSASALAEDLERWLRGEPIQARPVKTAERFWRWCRRNPKVAALGASVALLLLALSAGSMLVAFHINNLNRGNASKSESLRGLIVPNLHKLYSRDTADPVDLGSKVRRALYNLQPVLNPELELTFVEHVYEHPTNMVVTLSPVLNRIEEELGRRLRKRVAIHMRLFTTPTETYDAIATNPSTFGRMGPASFVQCDEAFGGVEILAVQNQTKPLTMVIYTVTNSPMYHFAIAHPDASLSLLLSNRWLALTHSNSTTGNYLAKRFLVTQGIHATTFARYSYEGSQRGVWDAVSTNRCDVGAGNSDVLDNPSKYPRLHVLASFPVPNLGRCWVAGKLLENSVAQELNKCLLDFTDQTILKGLESDVSGFKMPDADAMNQLRAYMREADAFDAVPTAAR